MIELDKSISELDADLAEILEDYLRRREAGTAPPRDELLTRHPDFAEQLEACLASLDFLGQAAPRTRTSPSPNVPLAPAVLADYRIVREIGRGGMGIVYEAEQLSSGNHVALKVLPFAASLDPLQRQRFRNEAQAAALLHHPHIVPVIEVGPADDMSFYAMKYVEGQSLADLIHQRRRRRAAQREDGTGDSLGSTVHGSDADNRWSEAARWGSQAAAALEHAHAAGIIHRDIKPGNLLLDTAGNLSISDFGLARFQNEARDLTQTGDLIGTLRYMSPEQAQGKRGLVDHRTDIYSLGATLYEVATLEPALSAPDRRELLRLIADKEPRPPRRLNPNIPRALETIILKALSKEPAARYATAGALAADLQRFLAGQPILAKRPTPAARLTRWARRHKPVVALAAVLVLSALAGLAVSSIMIHHEAERADRHAEQALQAVDDMYTQVAQRWWYQQPYMEELQREFLLKALAYYETYSREETQASRWRLEAAKAARRVADIHAKLGDHATALAAYDLAISRLMLLTEEAPANRRTRDELANAHNNRGNLLRELSRTAEAEAAYRAARTLFDQLVVQAPGSVVYRDGLAGSCANLGIVLHAQGQPADAERSYEQALALFTELVKESPTVPAYAHGLAGCQLNLAALLRDIGRLQNAQQAYEEALGTWTNLAAAWPGMPIFRQAQAAASSSLGIVHAALGHPQAAAKYQRQALALRQRLAADYPGIVAYRQALASSYHSLGRLGAASGATEEARAFYTQALALRQTLAGQKDAPPVYRQELADTYDSVAHLLLTAGQADEAENAARQALDLRRALVEDQPKTPATRWDLARSYRLLSTVLRSLGKTAPALEFNSAAVSTGEKLVAEFPNAAAFRGELTAAYSDRTSLLNGTRPAGANDPLSPGTPRERGRDEGTRTMRKP